MAISYKELYEKALIIIEYFDLDMELEHHTKAEWDALIKTGTKQEMLEVLTELKNKDNSCTLE